MDLPVNRVAAIRRRTTHDVSPHVAAPAQGGQPGGVDAADRLDEVRLPHAVNLQVLPRGQPQRAVAKLLGKDRGCANSCSLESRPAGTTVAEHEAIVRLPGRPARLAQLPPLVAVVLLIDPVLPQQLGRVVAEVVAASANSLGNPPAQTVALSLIVSTAIAL